MAVDIDELGEARRDPRVHDFLAAAGGYGARTMRVLTPGSRSNAQRDSAARESVSIEVGELQLARRDLRVRHLLRKAQDYGRGLERRAGLAPGAGGGPGGEQAAGTEPASKEQGQPQAQ